MIWLNNLKLVLEHNLLADQGIKSYRLGMNHFADMDNQEYQEMLKGCLGFFNETEIQNATVIKAVEGVALPRYVNWRARGYVTRVKDQSHCGSCWAFSATGALEGQIFKKRRRLVSLSEQQLVDCSRYYGNFGCQGGWPHRAFNYIRCNGLEKSNTYPYWAREGRCRANSRRAWARCSCFRIVCPSEHSLKYAVAKVGPISVAIDAGHHSFQLYRSGVYDEPACGKRMNHAVLVVGYGTYRRRKHYWLVKNSWGTRWGNRGYIRMSRNKWKQCGISNYAVVPMV
ncbi:hypothetical protein NFI96_027058 [Prochilodus magdalenae]|nr:hypothetical protein NFI96_027058 [Prochilodus magdalenae]